MIESKNAHSKLARMVADNHGHESFPDSQIDYYDRFTHIDDHLNKTIHPNVNVGPTAREPIWLTDHGPDHIATVIQRAGDLVFQPDEVLSPYECYIVLLACHFHDVGNIFGRGDHEKKVREVLFGLDDTLIGNDTLEKRVICDTAMAHGGYVDNDGVNKDTIGTLKYDRSTKSNGLDVKKLAAILRFADELADDKTRTNRFVQDAASQIYPESEIFHTYAAHLRPVEVSHQNRSVEVHFELNNETVTRQYRKFETTQFLFDEILLRTLKMHREHVYCSRFMIPAVFIERINVQIDVCSSDYAHVLAELRFTMTQHGYPSDPKTLTDICPELEGVTGHTLADTVTTLLASQVGTLYDSPVDLLPLSTAANSSSPADAVPSQNNTPATPTRWQRVKSFFGKGGNE